jgi:hypothetical protein
MPLRFAMNKLLADVAAGKVSKIVVWRLDRLGRTAKGLTALFEELVARKVTLISLKDGIDLLTPAGRLMANVLASVAAYETEIRGTDHGGPGGGTCERATSRPATRDPHADQSDAGARAPGQTPRGRRPRHLAHRKIREPEPAYHLPHPQESSVNNERNLFESVQSAAERGFLPTPQDRYDAERAESKRKFHERQNSMGRLREPPRPASASMSGRFSAAAGTSPMSSRPWGPTGQRVDGRRSGKGTAEGD